MFIEKLFRMIIDNECRLRTHMILIAERKRERLNFLFSCSCRTQENLGIERVNQYNIYLMIYLVHI